MSRERMTGRILNVWEEPLGTTLTADAAAGTTELTVDDVSPFNAAGNDDGGGGMLQVGDQVVAYLDVDDDASTITLTAGLPTAVTVGSENDDVLVWNDLYGEVDTVQWVLVKPGGNRNQADPIQAIVGEAVQGLTNGDRGGPGEPCTLVRDGDEWELVSVGRPSAAKSIKFEASDQYTLTAADVSAATATISLSHRPIVESLVAFYRGFPQRPSNYTINYDAQTITWALSGFEKAGDLFWVHYAYLQGVATPTIIPSYPDAVLSLSPTWYYRFENATNDDFSGNGRNASSYGGTTQVTGLLNSTPGLARQFDGTSTGFTAGGSGYTPSSWGSVAVIVNPTSGQAADGVLVGSMGSIAASHTFFVGVDSNGLAVAQCYGNAGVRLAGTTDLRGAKHLIVATFNPTTFDVKLYVDGALVASGNNSGGLTAGSGHLSVGYNDLGPNRYYKGTMDEPAFWANGVVITPQQVSDLYAAFTKGHQ